MDPTPTLSGLYALFPDSPDTPRAEPVAAADLPEPYRRLLVHTHHMTVTVEGFYGGPVDVKVLEVRHDEGTYARKILLVHRATGKVVQYGLVQIDLHHLAPEVRDEIVSERTPLGRVLIRHDVLRTVRPVEFFRVTPAPTMCEWFGLAKPETTYGRLGVISTDGKPAIKVLEILAPVPADMG